MKNTFVCDESMIITIPIGSIQDLQDGQLMPELFYCVFKDHFKVLVLKGKAQPLGAAQAIFGLLLCALTPVVHEPLVRIFTIPCIMYVICGGLSFAAGKCPNMSVAKLSFSLNIISLFWSLSAFIVNLLLLHSPMLREEEKGITSLITSLLVIEFFICLYLIYWLSKVICRQHFNTLPTIILKRGN
uniref:Uncharacterized protein n=1 Tax=Oryzias latipes TaxID=8090 RepID=A0A3P9KYJ4_ORYLA